MTEEKEGEGYRDRHVDRQNSNSVCNALADIKHRNCTHSKIVTDDLLICVQTPDAKTTGVQPFMCLYLSC